MGTCIEDLYALYRQAIHSQWLPDIPGAGVDDTLAYQLMFGPQQADTAYAPAMQRLQQPSTAPLLATIEDEETRHGPLPDANTRALPPSSEVRATVSIFSEPVPSEDEYPSRKTNTYSEFAAPQAGTSFQKPSTSHWSELFPSTSSFNPYAQPNQHSAYEFSAQPPFMPATISNARTHAADPAKQCEQPTDLSMPKVDPGAVNRTDSDTDDADDDDDDSAAHTPYKDRPTSPVRYPTYTHLSDVSNDSEDDAARSKSAPASKSYVFGKNLKNELINQLLHLGHPPNAHDKPKLISYQQAADYMLMKYPTPSHLPPALAYFLSLRQSQLVGTGKVIIRELDDSNDRQQNGAQQNQNTGDGRGQPNNREAPLNEGSLQNANEGPEVIDLTDDNDENETDKNQEDRQQPAVQTPPPEEQGFLQGPIVQPIIKEAQPKEPRAMYSLPAQTPLLGAESFTTTVQLSPTPAPKFILPAVLNNAGMQTATSCEQAHLAPESSMEPPPFQSASLVKNAKEEPPELPMTIVVPTELSSSPEDDPMERHLVAVPVTQVPPVVSLASLPKHSPPTLSESTPGTSQCPSQDGAAEEKASVCRKRSREPWDHKGLVSFIANNAFSLPRYVWIERKEGQPRRSMRIAKKKTPKKYFLRERQPSKSAPDKRTGWF